MPLSVDGSTAGEAKVGPAPSKLVSSLGSAHRDVRAWKRVHAKAADGRFLLARNPASYLPGTVPMLYLNARGHAVLSFITAGEDGALPASRDAVRDFEVARTLADVAEIQIWITTDGLDREVEMAKLVLQHRGAIRTLSGAELRASLGAPSTTLAPTGDGTRHGSGDDPGAAKRGAARRPQGGKVGWSITEVARLVVPKKRAVTEVRVWRDGPEPESFGAEWWTGDERRLAAKLNKRGDLVLQAYGPGGEKQQLRGVSRLEFVTAKQGSRR